MDNLPSSHYSYTVHVEHTCEDELEKYSPEDRTVIVASVSRKIENRKKENPRRNNPRPRTIFDEAVSELEPTRWTNS